jgi:enoyl-CoA hydratase/carnithine racemase
MTETILYEIKDRIAYITLNRPDSLNAMNLDFLRRWNFIVQDMNSNPEPLVGIVTGAGGKAFSVGADLKEKAGESKPAAGTGEGEQGKTIVERKPSGRRPRLIQKPVIAAINGFCLGGGLELALQCDIRIATPKSVFGMPEPRWSLPAGYGLHNLSRMIPLGEALYIQLTGERIGPERAYQIGLIQKIVPEEQLLAEAKKIADSVLLCAPLAVKAIKSVVMNYRDQPLEVSWKMAEGLVDELSKTEDFKEGPRAFAEKRKPQWKGR